MWTRKGIALPKLYKYFSIFYCESEIKYSENGYSKIMSHGQKRPQISSDCSICNLDFKNVRGNTPRPPFRCRLASLAGRYRPRNIYFLPHIQGGRSTPLCLFLFGTSGLGDIRIDLSLCADHFDWRDLGICTGLI